MAPGPVARGRCAGGASCLAERAFVGADFCEHCFVKFQEYHRVLDFSVQLDVTEDDISIFSKRLCCKLTERLVACMQLLLRPKTGIVVSGSKTCIVT